MHLATTQDIFELVLARPAAETDARRGTLATMPGLVGLVHLWWRAPRQGNHLVQVYVDGTLNTVTVDAAQRELWLMCDPGEPHLIEFLAVPADQADDLWRPRPERLPSQGEPTQRRAMLSLLRDERLPPDAVIVVSVDGNETYRGPLWPAGEHRGGFGALFGLGEFGRDALTGPGLGTAESQLGAGLLGAGGAAWTWTSSHLLAGAHAITAQAVDSTGGVLAELPEPLVVTIDAPSAAARTFGVASDFRLSWTQ